MCQEKGFCVRGDECEFDHGVDPVVIDDVLPGLPLPQPQQPPSLLQLPQPPSSVSLQAETQLLSGQFFVLVNIANTSVMQCH